MQHQDTAANSGYAGPVIRSAFDDPRLEDLYEHRTDVGNATWLAAVCCTQILYNYTTRTWMTWSGTRWEPDGIGKVYEFAKRALRYAQELVKAHPSVGVYDVMSKHLLKSESSERIQGMLRLAQSTLYVRSVDFDSDPWLLNVVNGLLDLRTGHLRKHQPKDLCARSAPVKYDADSTCHRWTRFLSEVFCGDTGVIEFIQRSIGYSLTGSTEEQCLFIPWGPGANGKSVFLNCIRTLLGDYHKHADASTFLAHKSEGARNDIAALEGARLVTGSELSDGKPLSESLIKQLTGCDPITARFLYGEYFTFTPQFKIWIATNQKPLIRGTEHAIWRRIRLIPFTRTFATEEQDKELSQTLHQELPGILAWAVRGCLNWQSSGLAQASAVTAATEDYRHEMDSLGNFLDAHCIQGLEHRVAKGDFYDRFLRWCEESGESALTKRDFGRSLRERGFTDDRTRDSRVWVGIKLRGTVSPSDDDA